MAEFTVNANRLDPYKNFKFRVKWDGKYVAGISKVSALKRTTEVVKHREGGDPSTSSQSRRAAPSTTPSPSSAASPTIPSSRSGPTRCWDYCSPAAGRRRSRWPTSARTSIIDVFNEAGQKVISYQIFRCWVSEYQAMPDFDANANAVAIQHIKLENEGWDRDPAVTEPTEPTFDDPTA